MSTLTAFFGGSATRKWFGAAAGTAAFVALASWCLQATTREVSSLVLLLGPFSTLLLHDPAYPLSTTSDAAVTVAVFLVQSLIVGLLAYWTVFGSDRPKRAVAALLLFLIWFACSVFVIVVSAATSA